MENNKIIEQLVKLEKMPATGSRKYRALKHYLKEYYDLDWDEIRDQYLKEDNDV